MHLGRDSVVWWLGVIAAVLAYLSQEPAPNAWTWAQWIQLASFVVGVVSAKLSTSPLPKGNQ